MRILYDFLYLVSIFLNFLRTGFHGASVGHIHSRLSNAGWWAMTAGSASSGYGLSTGPTESIPWYHHIRGYGFAIRCVTREG